MSQSSHIKIRLPHVELHALSWGEPTDPLALCLHGFPDSAYTWRQLGPRLAEAGYYVVAPFTRGYAPSTPAADHDYSVEALARDALAIREQIGEPGEAVLIGHDWGGITAQALSADKSRTFARVVSLAIPPLSALSAQTQDRHRELLWPLLGQTRLSWYIAFNQLPLLPERFAHPLVRHLWRKWSPGYDSTPDLPHVFASMSDHEHRRAIFNYYRALRKVRPDAAWLQDPLVPTLYLHGAQDGCFSSKLSRAAGSTEIPAAGHFLHLEQPEVVAEAVLDFLARS
ncbi:MAG TPA: alpha/beta hydrolase [Marmoricola sp.]|nr:alpha/beta hydrolase [Marmoricola sp.]